MIDYKRKPRAGFVGFGEVNTPRELIDEKCEEAALVLEKEGIELFKTAPVSDDAAGKQAERAVCEISKKNFDVLILCVAGWIPSWAVFSVIENFKNKPIILLGLAGRLKNGRFVTTADQAGTAALRKPMEDMGYDFKYVVSRCGEKFPAREITSYCRAASAAGILKNAKIGMAGYRDMRLYGTVYDGVSLKGKIGPEIEHFDLLELKQIMDGLKEGDVDSAVGKMKSAWDFMKKPEVETLENSARLYLALRRKIDERGYDAFSYCDVDGIKKNMGFAPAGAMTLLHDELNIPTVPENDSHGCVTQLIVRYLTGQVGAYLEFYEFTRDGALMGVPDYVPAEIVEGKVRILPNSFGDFGEGLLNVSNLKTGRAVICRLSNSGDKYCMHVMPGTAKEPFGWEEAGWAPPAPQLPSVEFMFDGDAEEFIQKVSGQHYIISYGDNAEMIKDFCRLKKIDLV